MLSFRPFTVKLLIIVIVLTGLAWWRAGECDVPHYKVLLNQSGKQVKWWFEDLPAEYTINTDSCETSNEESVRLDVRFGFDNWNGDSPSQWKCQFKDGEDPLVQNFVKWTYDLTLVPYKIVEGQGFWPVANTRLYTDPGTGQIQFAETYFNEAMYDWSVNTEEGMYYIMNTATHEAGHWVGLDDLYGIPGDEDYYDGKTAMYGVAIPNDDSRSFLYDWDREGFSAIYPGDRGGTWGWLKSLYCGDLCSHSSGAGWPGPRDSTGQPQGTFSRIGGNFVRWSDFDSSAYSYRLLKGVGDSLSFRELEDPAERRTYIDEGIIGGQPYYYRVASYDVDTTITWNEYTSPSMVGTAGIASCTLDSSPRFAVVEDDKVYVFESGGTVEIVDVSIPEAPVTLGSFELGTVGVETALDAEVRNDILYIASTGTIRIAVVDVSDPSSPVRTDEISDSLPALSLDLSYPWLYCARGYNMTIFNVSNPWSIIEVGCYYRNHPGVFNITHVYVVGDMAFVTNDSPDYGEHGLHLVDVGLKMIPWKVSIVEVPPDWPHPNFPPAWRVHDFDGTYAYAEWSGGFRGIIDVSDPENPTVSHYFYPALFSWMGYGDLAGRNSLAKRGDYLYVIGHTFFRRSGCLLATEWGGVEIFDVSTPESPQFISAIADTGYLWADCDSCSTVYTCLAESEDHVYLLRYPAWLDSDLSYQLQVYRDNAECDGSAISASYSSVSLDGLSPYLGCPSGDAGGLLLDVAVRDDCGNAVAWIPASSVYVVAHDNPGWISCLGDTSYATEATDGSGRTTIEIPRYGGCGDLILDVYAEGVLIAQPTVTVRSPDFNADCVVDAADDSLFGEYWNSNDPCGDLNGRDGVDLADFSLFGDHYNQEGYHFCVDPHLSQFSLELSNPECFVLCPKGDIQSLGSIVTARNSLDGVFEYSSIAAESIRVTVPPPNSPGIDASFRFVCRSQKDRAIADHDTDANEQTTVTVNSGGGHSENMPMRTALGGWVVVAWVGTAKSPDIDGSGRVDYSDVMIFSIDDQGDYHYRSDMNCDGDIDDTDLLFINSHYGHRCGASSHAMAGGETGERPWSQEVVDAIRGVVPDRVLDRWLSYDLHPELTMLLEDVRSLAEPQGLAKDGDAVIAAQANLVPQVSGVAQSVPNPFKGTAAINYQVAPPGGRIEIVIFDVAGRRVRTLLDQQMPPGFYVASWDGRNDDGRRMASGIYFYKMRAPGFTSNKRMILVR